MTLQTPLTCPTQASQQVLKILDEVRKNGGEPYQKLRDKARWEHMSLTAVIKTWGDPRKWEKA